MNLKNVLTLWSIDPGASRALIGGIIGGLIAVLLPVLLIAVLVTVIVIIRRSGGNKKGTDSALSLFN